MMTKKTTFMHRISGWIAGPASEGRGVASMTAPRFFIVLLLYIGALIVFARDPFFRNNGIFVYRQGIVTVFFAFVLTASLNWEMLHLNPECGALPYFRFQDIDFTMMVFLHDAFGK